jgi:hypothetical protein
MVKRNEAREGRWGIGEPRGPSGGRELLLFRGLRVGGTPVLERFRKTYCLRSISGRILIGLAALRFRGRRQKFASALRLDAHAFKMASKNRRLAGNSKIGDDGGAMSFGNPYHHVRVRRQSDGGPQQT